MHGSALKIKGACSPRLRSARRVGPTLSRVADAGGPTKRCAKWAFVSGVPPVSPYLKLIERIQKEKVGNGRKGISGGQAPCAETGGTGAKVTRVCGETTVARHTWDRWDPSKHDQGAKVPRFNDARTRRLNLVTRLRGPPRSPDARLSNSGRKPQIMEK
jgi:hypothetical protein